MESIGNSKCLSCDGPTESGENSINDGAVVEKKMRSLEEQLPIVDNRWDREDNEKMLELRSLSSKLPYEGHERSKDSCSTLRAVDSFENPSTKKTTWSKRNVLAFLLFGLVNNFAYVIMLSAADKILEGQQAVNTGVVLLFDIIPAMAIKYTFPWFGHLIPYWIKIVLITITSILSFILVASGQNTPIRLVGVAVASLSSGFGEPTFLGLTTFYET
jgi:hypothetical protein